MNAVDACRQWVEDFVLVHDLCPFAHRPWEAKQVSFQLCAASQEDELYRFFLEEVMRFVSTSPEKEETSLIVFSPGLASFPDFWTYAGRCEELLAEAQADHIIQLAHFHPHYQFAETAIDAPGNRTNQSPYPILQLLRVDSVARAVEAYPEVDKIPERNVVKMENLGREE